MDCVILSGFEGPTWNRSIGPYSLCHYLRKQGFESRVVDFVNHMSEADLEDILSRLITNSTKLLGVSTTFLEGQNSLIDFLHNTDKTYIPYHVEKVLKSLKLKYPKLTIVAGGAKSTYLLDCDFIDVVVHGFAEDSILKLIRDLGTPNMNFYSKENNKIVISTQNVNWDISSSDFRFTENDGILPKETLPIEIARGCVFRCKFCAFPLLGKKKFDYLRDPERIKDEFIHNYEKWGTTNYMFTDDTFNDSTYKLESLYKVISTLPFKINFVSYLRLDLLRAHKEQAILLKEMGLLSAFFGLETLNPKSASVVGKGANCVAIKEYLPELYYDLWKETISITSSLIVGLPYETEDNIRETFSYFEKYKNFHPAFFPLSFRNAFYLSEFEKDPSKYGYIIRGELDWTSPWMSSKKAMELVRESQAIFNPHSKPSTWLTASLLSHNYSKEDLLKVRIDDLNFKSLYKQKLQMVRQYKDSLWPKNQL